MNKLQKYVNVIPLRHIFKESGRGTNLLQFAEIQLLDNEACIVPYNDMTRQNLFHSKNMICAGIEKVNSPLVVTRGVLLILIPHNLYTSIS